MAQNFGYQFAGNLQKYAGHWNDMPVDSHMLISLIAPRPCVWEVGDKDALVNPKWADAALTRLKRAYTAFNAADNLKVDHFDGPHRWNGAVAFPLLDRILKA